MPIGAELGTLANAMLQRADRCGLDAGGRGLSAVADMHGIRVDAQQTSVLVREVTDQASTLRPLPPRDGRDKAAALGRPPNLQ